MPRDKKEDEMKNDVGNLESLRESEHTFITSFRSVSDAINGTLKTNKTQIDFFRYGGGALFNIDVREFEW